MDLRKWWTEVQDSSGKDKGHRDVPDYDSTKANFDELERGQEEVKRWYKKCLERLEFHNHEPPAWTKDFEERLTALEAKVEKVGFDCPYDNCARYPCWRSVEDRVGCHRISLPDTPEPKVDAPEKQKQEAELRLRCIGCGKEGSCSQERSKICDLGGHGHPRCFRFLAPPDTCGTCSRPARFEDNKHQVVCGYRKGKYENRWACDTACPHHERREA